jgi:hypothetical protein
MTTQCLHGQPELTDAQSNSSILLVKPFLASALDKVGKLQIKISGIRPNTDADTTYFVDGIPRVVAVEVVDTFP